MLCHCNFRHVKLSSTTRIHILQRENTGSETPASLLLLRPQKSLRAEPVFSYWGKKILISSLYRDSELEPPSLLTATGLFLLRWSIQVVWRAVNSCSTGMLKLLDKHGFQITQRASGYSRTTSPICFDPLFSNSARTLVSNANDATRKKNSLTFSPAAHRRQRSAKGGDETMKVKEVPCPNTHRSGMKQPSTPLWSLGLVWEHLVQSESTEQETVKKTKKFHLQQKMLINFLLTHNPTQPSTILNLNFMN